MNTLKFFLLPALMIAAVACSPEAPEETNGDEPVGKTVNVETKQLEPRTFQSKLRVVGNVETKNDIMISAEVTGRVVEQLVEEGAVVEEGDVLLRIDDAKLQQEKARLEALTQQARENYERLKTIFEEDSIGSEIEYLNAKYNYQQTKSSLESIKVDLENTRIKAPFDGTVERFMLEVGEMASPGMQVLRLIGTDTYIVSAGVPARYAEEVTEGDDVDIWFDTQADDSLKGTITFAGKSIDPQNRTFRIEVLLPPNSRNYKVDMIANMSLNTLSEDNVLIVSEEFIYKQDNEFVTYVKAENDEGQPVAERRTVTLGPSFRSDVIIRDGLQAGEELITIGSAFLNDGMRLNIVESRDKSLASNK
ncbi:efflux RND transporter periplasmic adaptor subunit [Gracilimonas mengyeensis]|uniref:RND family efflux transporter, MFP subunit n=1 Tax=Gracilimonas mengyeensis TaxID=1302730 RepID=A0A521BXB9_9BACT|nr:efflux RND transporter periplasmic adaptor subunit [Gracilimonas mengyeensis]SMO51675.1 RND family efflux transporter, MFP subunit [Gracilimonas mengyeensis]